MTGIDKRVSPERQNCSKRHAWAIVDTRRAMKKCCLLEPGGMAHDMDRDLPKTGPAKDD